MINQDASKLRNNLNKLDVVESLVDNYKIRHLNPYDEYINTRN